MDKSSSNKQVLKRFRPELNTTVKTILTRYGQSVLEFVADNRGNALLSGNGYELETYDLYLYGQTKPIVPTIEGKKSFPIHYDFYYNFIGRDGKIYLAARGIKWKSQSNNITGNYVSEYRIQFYTLDGQDFKKFGKALVSKNRDASGATLAPWQHLGDKKFSFGIIADYGVSPIEPRMYDASGPTVTDITGLPSGHQLKILPSYNSSLGGERKNLYSGKDGLYVFWGQEYGPTKTIYRLPYSDPSQFEQVFDGSGLENIYDFSLRAGDSGDKLAIAAETPNGKHSIILLDVDGTNKRKIDVGENEVRNLQLIQ